jgi:hypothetical protein
MRETFASAIASRNGGARDATSKPSAACGEPVVGRPQPGGGGWPQPGDGGPHCAWVTRGDDFSIFNFPISPRSGAIDVASATSMKRAPIAAMAAVATAPRAKPRNARRVWVFMFFSSLVTQSLGSKGVKQPGEAM